MKRFLWLCVIVVLFLICTGCGDTYRPVIIPNTPKFPDPRASHSVIAISDNNTDPSHDPPQSDPGTIMSINVAGDTVVSVADVGLAPVHAVQQTANQVLVVNQSVTGALGDSLTKVAFSGTTISGTPITITLPPDSAPNFVASTETGTAYVSLPGFSPPSVAVISTTSNALVTTLPVGDNPIAMAETPDGNKLYVANNGSGTISNFNTKGRTARNSPPITLSSAPLWISARSDSQRVFALESNGTLAVLDTTSTAGPDTLIETAISVPGAMSMIYDGHLNRLYIPGGSQLAVVDVSPSVPQLLKSVPISQIPGLPAVAVVAVAVAALPDGSRAYVASVGAAQSSQVNISGVLGDGTTATYTYTLTGGHDLTPGIIVDVSGIGNPAGFDGTFTIKTVSGASCNLPTQVCTFTAANTTIQAQTAVAGLGSSVVDNLFPQVTVINTSDNTVKTTAGIPGFPDATVPGSPYYVPVCALTDTKRFRFMMAAGGDSSRVYLSSCDAGNVNIIDTTTDTYTVNLPAPKSSRAPITGTQPPPQNPVFLFAGP